MTLISLGSIKMMKVRSWPSLVLKSKTECFMVLSLQHHIPPFITSHSPLLFSFPPQEFSPKHTTAVEEYPVHQASSDARAEDLSPAPHSPPHCKWEAAALITPGWTVGEKKKEPNIKDQILPDSGNLGVGLALQLSQNCSGNQNY